MQCEIIRREDAPITVWSGGSTTEYFIYPPGADYAARNFDLRISRAEVELARSEFTSLPGYTRLLMPLDAPLRLVYQDQGEVSLKPSEATVFDGGWHTTSYGVCTDIGLMFSPAYQGRMEAAANGSYVCPIGFTGVYAPTDGTVTCPCGTHTLRQGDFFLLYTQKDTEITLDFPDGQRAVCIQAFPV